MVFSTTELLLLYALGKLRHLPPGCNVQKEITAILLAAMKGADGMCSYLDAMPEGCENPPDGAATHLPQPGQISRFVMRMYVPLHSLAVEASTCSELPLRWMQISHCKGMHVTLRIR